MIVPRTYSLASGAARSGGTSVGAVSELMPLRCVPTVVSKAEYKAYGDVVDTLIRALANDSRNNLIEASPGKLEADASNLRIEARDIDGCDEYGNLCDLRPGGPLADSPKSPKGAWSLPVPLSEKQKKAGALRERAYRLEKRAVVLRERAKKQGLANERASNDKVLKQISLAREIEGLDRNWFAYWGSRERLEQMTFWGSDWKEVQRFDVEMQSLRKLYEALGFRASGNLPPVEARCDVPINVSFGSGPAETVVTVAMVGLGIYAASTLLGSRKAAA